MKKITKIYQALSDETRLRILNLLHEGELCVCHIMDVLETGQSKISRHLTYLKNAGLVHNRRNGLWVYYSLSKDKSYIPLLKCLKELRVSVRQLKNDSERMLKKKDEASLLGMTIDTKCCNTSKTEKNSRTECKC
ncbi:MAG: metalloregulator ArsR/SmtB family transcription factor [Deltaproteobacteria bacterium]|nr:metalloregulator ArsR/SmtB family transcription factor [Deltaproteobacteria bacterium]